jgi:hypothetical protein
MDSAANGANGERPEGILATQDRARGGSETPEQYVSAEQFRRCCRSLHADMIAELRDSGCRRTDESDSSD